MMQRAWIYGVLLFRWLGLCVYTIFLHGEAAWGFLVWGRFFSLVEGHRGGGGVEGVSRT